MWVADFLIFIVWLMLSVYLSVPKWSRSTANATIFRVSLAQKLLQNDLQRNPLYVFTGNVISWYTVRDQTDQVPNHSSYEYKAACDLIWLIFFLFCTGVITLRGFNCKCNLIQVYLPFSLRNVSKWFIKIFFFNLFSVFHNCCCYQSYV